MGTDAGHVVPWELARLEKRGFERIAGGEARAAEIADAIRRQQELVSKGSA